MLSKEELRARLHQSLDSTIYEVNRALRGENTEQLEEVLTRLGRGGQLPKWYEQLRTQHTLPNLDGKTIGSVIEILKLQIIKFKYLDKTQIADYRLCQIARKHREWLVAENEAWVQKVFRFLAYVNQSDWRAKQLLRLLDCLQDSTSVQCCIQQAYVDFQKVNKKRIAKEAEPIPMSDIESLQKINSIQPFYLGVIDAADNWVIEMQKDLARFPSSNEWTRILTSPLDGQIGMSPALQWRYNFSRVFGVPQPLEDALSLAVDTQL